MSEPVDADILALIDATSDVEELRQICRLRSLYGFPADLLLHVGRAYLGLKAFADAESSFREVLRRQEDHAEALQLLAITLFNDGRFDDCLGIFRQIHDRYGVNRALIEPFAFALCSTDQADEASEFLDWTLAVWPDEPDIVRAKAHQCFAQAKHLPVLLWASRLSLDYLKDGSVGLEFAASASTLGRPDLAIRILDGLFPADARLSSFDYLALRGAISYSDGEYADAERWFERATALRELEPGQQFTYFAVLAQQGKYRQAWDRYHQRDEKLRRVRIRDIPEWRGEPLAGKTIIVHAEQGIGDNIHFLRYLRPLGEMGGRVIYDTYPSLLQLIAHINPERKSLDEQELFGAVDYQTWLLDLPGRLNIPQMPAEVAGQHYLQCPRSFMEKWALRLGDKSKVRVGLVWAGNPDFANDHNRSAALADLAPLASVPGIEWYSLQMGNAAKAEGFADFPCRLVNLATEIGDLADTAGILANLDLLITVDTSVAHLAGALGRPAWMLHARCGDWRWGAGESTAWYATVRIFRQQSDWLELATHRIRPALAQFVDDILMQRPGQFPDSGRQWLAAERTGSKESIEQWARQSALQGCQQDAARVARALALDLGCPGPLEYLSEAWKDPSGTLARAYFAEWLAASAEADKAFDVWEAIPLEQTPVSSLIKKVELLLESGHTDKAEALASRSLELFPDSAGLATAYGIAMQRMGRALKEVKPALERATKLQSRNPVALWALGEISIDQGEGAPMALKYFDAALRLRFGDRNYWNAFYKVAAKLGFVEFAALQTAGERKHESLEAAVLDLPVMARLGDIGFVADVFDRIRQTGIERLPPAAIRSLSYAVTTTRLGGDLVPVLEQWLQRRDGPRRSDDERNVALCLAAHYLRHQSFGPAWSYFLSGLRDSFPLSLPEWDGQDRPGLRILAYQDQGYGDLIQFLPVVEELAQRAAVTLAVYAPISSLLMDQGLHCEVTRVDDLDRDNSPYDVQCRLMKLVSLHRTNLLAPLHKERYIRSARRYPQIEELTQRGGCSKVGLVWAGNPGHLGDLFRSSRLRDWKAVFDIEGIRIFSFQKDAPSQQAIPYPFIENMAEHFDDFSAAAAAIQEMDVMMGVDTGLLHLAAAMGKPTWMVLPYHGQDARWFDSGETYPWYPTLRLFRRDQDESWSDAIERAARALADWMRSGTGSSACH